MARAGRWCANPENRAELTQRLAHRTYLDLDGAIIERALPGTEAERTLPGAPIGFGAEIQEPRLADAQWLLAQMQAARQIVDPAGLLTALPMIYRSDLFSAAATDI